MKAKGGWRRYLRRGVIFGPHSRTGRKIRGGWWSPLTAEWAPLSPPEKLFAFLQGRGLPYSPDGVKCNGLNGRLDHPPPPGALYREGRRGKGGGGQSTSWGGGE
jgi:hypothetical protein